ncbi:MAG: hypothetical protein JOZ59_05435 [Candidatus Eremiobacteraeota bacterium]|nr:hypothetical protein [Candidatus Eremiobacteraeota bacterium]
MRLIAAVLAASFCIAPALAQQATPASSTAAENPSTTALARAQFDALRAGTIDRSKYTADVNSHLTDAVVSEISRVLSPGGAVKTFAYAGNAVQSGVQVAQYSVEFEHPISVPMMPTTALWNLSIATDKDGKISSFSLSPKK